MTICKKYENDKNTKRHHLYNSNTINNQYTIEWNKWSLMVDEKRKTFKFPIELAIEFEVQAKKIQSTEAELAMRYIEEGLRRDKNQTTLD